MAGVPLVGSVSVGEEATLAAAPETGVVVADEGRH